MAVRVVAFFAAISMVVAAFAVRQALNREPGDSDNEFVFVCASELGDLCNDVNASSEPANRTADRLIGLARSDDPGLDAWLAPGPWPQMVDAVRRFDRRQPLFEQTDSIGGSPLVLVSRAGGLTSACAAKWTCINEAALSGSQAVGAPSISDASGVLVRAAALTARIGAPDYARDQIETHALWLNELNKALDRSQFGAGSLQRFLTTPGSADAFATTRAAAHTAGVTDTFDIDQPAPAVVVALSLGLRDGASRPSDLEDELVEEHGWTVEPSADTNHGLPSADVVYALRDFL